MRRRIVNPLLLSAIGCMAFTFVKYSQADEKTTTIKIGPASYTVPEVWNRQKPANNMRVAQFSVPLEDGDEGKTELVVFYFGGQGGGVQENLKRWKDSFEEIDGEAKTDKFDAGSMKVTTIDITGSYKDKPAPFLPDFKLRKDWRMIAAVVETADDGPYFFRLVGPKKTVGKNAETYVKMLKNAKAS